MSFPIVKKASYILINTPDMVMHCGTTAAVERKNNPNSEFLKQAKNFLRLFEDVVAYPPNQTYIGNITPEQLLEIERPWQNSKIEGASKTGKFGEIMPEDEFYGLLKISDVFNLVILEKGITQRIKEKFAAHELLSSKVEALSAGEEIADIKKLVDTQDAQGLYLDDVLVGCVKKAHDVDTNLSAHIMLENLTVKASGVLALMHLIKLTGIDVDKVDYLIECSEEAIGDMNQRGGGNLAKACGEIAGIKGATGIDMRGFCAGPAHAIINASALVKSGIFKNVIVFAGGCSAKLGMNGRDHVKKGLPILEDCLGGFALLITENDGISPEIRTDIIGKHTIADGSAPQAVIEALVLKPLSNAKMKITDVDKYAPELQNPDITEPAGAGDVPTQNYKMIGALAVKYGQLERKELPSFVLKHGYTGFAPTQGHIPSAVPIVGHGIDAILDGKINNFMLIGKGSLFLGRMTNLFDGVSVLVQKNSGKQDEESQVSHGEIKMMIADSMKKFAEILMNE
jgi:glycine/sarcosine/betaine reductase complex component C subunit beta